MVESPQIWTISIIITMDLGYETATTHWWTYGGKCKALPDTTSEGPENTMYQASAKFFR